MSTSSKSPAKTLRDVKRMARFNYMKRSNHDGSQSSITTQYPVDIPPSPKLLNTVKCVSISLSPPKPANKCLSITKTSSTDLPPDPLPCFYCDLVCPKPNLPDTPTSPFDVCYICQKPLSFFARDPMECCGSLFHENCWGEHVCKTRIFRWCLMVPMVLSGPHAQMTNLAPWLYPSL